MILNFKFFHKESLYTPNLIVIIKSVKIKWNYLVQSFESILNRVSHYIFYLYFWFLDPIPMGVLGCVGGTVHIELRNSQTPTGCPRIQLYSDPIYPEIVSDSMDRMLSPTGLPPLQIPATSPGGYLCFWPTSYRSEVPMTPSNSGCQW